MKRPDLKFLHLIGTIWFVLCSLFLIIFTLREAKLKWWLILSLSGQSISLLILLFLVYLFAIFRGATRIAKSEQEHPLTVTKSYMFFYYLSPCIGALAGLAGMWGEKAIIEYLLEMAMGTLVTTFAVWIILDPAISLIEMVLPGSRESRHSKILLRRAKDEERRQLQQKIIDAHEARQKQQQEQWAAKLNEKAEGLKELLRNNPLTDQQREERAVDIGIQAWQTGGIDCMKWLYDRVKEKQTGIFEPYETVQISAWWDGIGTWTDHPAWEIGRKEVRMEKRKKACGPA
jgi:hypothetical protein